MKDARNPVLRRMAMDSPSPEVMLQTMGVLPSISNHMRSVDGRLLPQARRPRRVLRKEYRMMSDAERNKFHNAIRTLYQRSGAPSGMWHQFSLWHVENFPTAHGGSAFLPWHRHFLTTVEDSLQTIDPSIALPYWDSSMDNLLPEPLDSIIWTPLFMGNAKGRVSSGPFSSFNNIEGDRLSRNFGELEGGSLPTQERLDYVTSRRKFSDLVFCHDSIFEGMHDLVHVKIGGDMQTGHSPDDPIFYLHHAFVDKLWEEMRTKSQRTNRETDYSTPGNDHCSEGHGPNSPMSPFESTTNIDGLSNDYTSTEYTYQAKPTCSRRNRNCGSDYLFCDTTRQLCLPKVRMGGNCRGLESFDSCHGGTCRNGRCRRGGTTTRTTRRTTRTTRRTTRTTRRTTRRTTKRPSAIKGDPCHYSCRSQHCRTCCRNRRNNYFKRYCVLCQKQIAGNRIERCGRSTRHTYGTTRRPRHTYRTFRRPRHSYRTTQRYRYT